jgi:hypothetical protein
MKLSTLPLGGLHQACLLHTTTTTLWRNNLKINIESCPIPVSCQFVQILETEIEKSKVDPSHGIVINFRDPDYSSSEVGYHPVEVLISATGHIQYITDFAYVGTHYPELAKELDWDLTAPVFGHMGPDYPLSQGKSMFKIWQKNFCHNVQNNVFQVIVSSLG